MMYIFYTLLTQQIWDEKIYNKIMIVLFVVKKYMKKEKISNIMKHKKKYQKSNKKFKHILKI